MSDPGAALSFQDQVVPLWRTAPNQRQFSSWASGLGIEAGHGEPTGFPGFSSNVGTEHPSPPTDSDGDLFEVAYKKGWEDGQASFAEEQNAESQTSDNLAAAIGQVNDLASASSYRFILTAVESLFRRCAELAVPDPALLQAWAAQLADMVDQDQKGATLIMHPDDLSLIDSKSCTLALRGDGNMLRGTIKLSHSGGWIEKGSEVVLDELRTLIDEYSGASESGHE